MKCQNVDCYDATPCEHEAKFIMYPNTDCQCGICSPLYLCEYCVVRARMFTDDILDIEAGVTFEQVANQHKMQRTVETVPAFEGDQSPEVLPVKVAEFKPVQLPLI